MGDWGEKSDKRSINKKPPKLDEEMWEKKRKFILLMKKIFNLDLG